MKRMILSTILLGLLAWTAAAQTTEFTYQGNLNVSNSPTTGNYDFEFALFDAVTNGAQVGPTLTRSSVGVTAGAFSVKLDFGAQFPGANRYLEIRVRQSGGGAFQLLTPRQQINSAPYSIKSVNADNATNATNATTAATATNALQLGGVAANQYVMTGDARLSDARNPLPGSTNYIQNQNVGPQASSNFSISGNGTVGGTLAGNIVRATNSFDMNAGGSILYARGTSNNPSLPPTNTFVGILSGVPTPVQLNSSDNSAFGYSSGFALTSGSSNSFFGSKSGAANDVGFSNSFFGSEAGTANTGGSANSFFGSVAGRSNTSGGANSFFGEGSGIVNSTGGDNSFFGRHAGGLNSTGAFNTFLGSFSGTGNDIGNNNSLVGYFSNTLQGNLTNATAIGWRAAVNQNNSLVLGSINGVNGANASTNVGIGTTAPTERLHVVGNGLFTGNLTVNGTLNLPSFAGQFIQNTTTQQANSNFNISGNGIVGGNLSVGNAGTSARIFLNRATAIPANSADINFYSAGTADFSLGTSLGSAPALDLSIYSYGTGSNVLTIERNTGKVGIGTTNPEYRLHAVGSNYGGVWGTSTDSNGVYGSSSSSTGVKGETFGANALSTGVKGDSANGIGVWGSGGNAGVYGVGTGMFGYGVSGTSANSYAGYFSGNVHVTGILTQNSDARLKQNINKLGYGLSEVLRLRPVTWLWKDRPDRGPQLGLVAQEVESVLPELVSISKDGEQTKGLNYIGLVPILVNAVKEQQKQIESLARENSELKEAIGRQQQQIDSLRQALCDINQNASVCRH